MGGYQSYSPPTPSTLPTPPILSTSDIPTYQLAQPYYIQIFSTHQRTKTVRLDGLVGLVGVDTLEWLDGFEGLNGLEGWQGWRGRQWVGGVDGVTGST